MNYPVFVSCPKGLEYLLEVELRSLQFAVSRVSPQGVFGDVDIETLYRVCLWSRLASRVQLILLQGEVVEPRDLYALCRKFPWDNIFTVDKSLAIAFHGESEEFRHSLFGAQVVKDAIVDFFREKNDDRPRIERVRPDVLLHVHLKNNAITVSLDMTGYSLHQRGYRLQTGLAPLKEQIAAAILLRMQWPKLAAEGRTLQDPCCGSGTLVIEAAMMAADIAPGILRYDQAFVHWMGHQATVWDKLVLDAKERVHPPLQGLVGSDKDASVLILAKENAKRAGVDEWVLWKKLPMLESRPLSAPGLVVTNPPYGVRLGEEEEWLSFYQELGQVLHTHYQGWEVGVFTSSMRLAKAIGLRSHKQYTLFNGPLECKLVCITLDATNRLNTTPTPFASVALADMFVNRVKKNHAYLQKWAKRNQVTCYRIYDADLPDFSFAIDWYDQYVVVQEYMAPASIDEEKVLQRRMAALKVLPQALNVPEKHVVFKERKQQKGIQQYQKLGEQQQHIIVSEGRARFKLNLTDYLDTGLFLDHRPLRQQFGTLASGTRFLNCFCYTGSASVHAALAGAATVNVDLSNTYLTWAKENFEINQLDIKRHQFIQADCLEWLKLTDFRFDVIFLDPPSFSNSKRMHETLDIQRDHEALIASARRLLLPGGVLYFSTNLRQFKLSEMLINDPKIRDITVKTIDVDFKRNMRIHRCYRIEN